MGEDEVRKDPDIDGGFAWAILTGCFFMYMLVVGNIKSYGVLYTEMLTYYDAGSGNTAWIGSVCLLLMLGLGPIANLLSRAFTFRVVAFTGGLFLGVGFSISFFVTSISALYVTFGLVVGIGYGLSFSPCSTIINFYFEKHRALVNGITVSASGIGAFFLPFFYRYLISVFSLPGTFLIIGAIMFNVCVAACIFRQPKLLVQMKEQAEEAKKNQHSEHKGLLNGDTSHHKDEEQAKTSDETKKSKCDFDFLKLSLFKNPRFVLYVVSFVFCMNGYGNNLILIPSHTKSLGYDDFKVALSVSIMGGCEVIARIGFGWFADKDIVQRKHIFLFNMFIAAIFAFIAPYFKSYTFIAIYAAVIGIFPGSFWSLISVLIIEVVGMKDFTAAFGLLSFCLALGASISQPTIGWLQDYYGNWDMSFVLTGCLLLASALVISLEPLLARCTPKPDNEAAQEQSAMDQMPLRIRHKSTPPDVADDTESLVDEEVDVSFTSARISRIYRPYKPDTPPRSPDSATAPIVDPSEI